MFHILRSAGKSEAGAFSPVFLSEGVLMRKFMSKRKFLGLALLGPASSAFAAVDEAVSTALTTAATDGASVAGQVLLVIIAIMAVKYIRKAM